MPGPVYGDEMKAEIDEFPDGVSRVAQGVVQMVLRFSHIELFLLTSKNDEDLWFKTVNIEASSTIEQL
jgi:hypothetical protein